MLSLKYVAIESFNENVVYLHKDCEEYRVDEIDKVTRVEVLGGTSPLFAFLEVVDDETIIGPNELGLNAPAFEQLNLPEGSNVTLSLSTPPPSKTYIQKKIAGNVLLEAEYRAIVNDIVNKKYSNADITAFLVATSAFMGPQEVLNLTSAMSGKNKLFWDEENIVVDHHCLGGVPGNKTDIVITAIVAAYGLPMPKTASRSLTSSSGCADVFSVLADVNVDENKLKKIIKNNRGAIIDYTNLEATKASQIISSAERSLGFTQQKHILASILAIKLSTGITHLVLDIPVGETSHIKSTHEALHIRKMAEYIGDNLGIEIDAVITDGREPIGNGVGPVLEARDIMRILRNKPDAPQDLLEKSLFLAGRVLEFDPKLRGGKGYNVAKEILTSGRALDALGKIIYAQGKAPQAQLGHLTREVVATKSGVIEAIDNTQITKIALLTGVSQHFGAGLDLLKKVDDTVSAGEPLYRIHATNSSDFAFANSVVEGNSGYKIR